ncbi:MAG TPA: hypothetical protein VFV38_31405 [Ktedonobacteraceae bacterium]|nr:hypothetical protein [Ktedonobacteraceae bacterium]
MKIRMLICTPLFLIAAVICFMGGGGTGLALGSIFILAAIICGALFYFLWNRDQQVRLRSQRNQEPMMQKQRKPPRSDPRSRGLTGGRE